MCGVSLEDQVERWAVKPYVQCTGGPCVELCWRITFGVRQEDHVWIEAGGLVFSGEENHV